MRLPDEAMSWPVLAQSELGVGRVSTFVNETLETPDGEQVQRQYLTHPGAVAIVPWDQDNDRVAVLRQYRHPVRSELLEIPAGLLDLPDEPWLLAAERELAEEVELAANRWDVLVDICTSPGSSAESLRIYLARELRATARPAGFELAGEEAHMTWDWVARAELVDAVLAGQCHHRRWLRGYWRSKLPGFLIGWSSFVPPPRIGRSAAIDGRG